MSKNNKKICLINSEYANLYSVQNALKALGYEYDLVSDYKKINNYDLFILPGVGSFEQVKNSLVKAELFDSIKHILSERKPLLGICLGYQLLFQKSFETNDNTSISGFEYFRGDINPLPKSIIERVPHIGWNKLFVNTEHSANSKIFQNIDIHHLFVYFVHSFYAEYIDNNDLLAYTKLGSNNQLHVPAIVYKDNICGMQFHPEKSGDTGLQLIKNFIDTH